MTDCGRGPLVDSGDGSDEALVWIVPMSEQTSCPSPSRIAYRLRERGHRSLAQCWTNEKDEVDRDVGHEIDEPVHLLRKMFIGTGDSSGPTPRPVSEVTVTRKKTDQGTKARSVANTPKKSRGAARVQLVLYVTKVAPLLVN